MAKRSLRLEYGKILARYGAKNKDIIVLEADLKESTQSVQFQKAFPERFVEVGIAEQNMVGIAAGLALGGKIPIAHSFACFISMRACEQVRTSVAYPKLNVKFLVTHGGVSTGTAGTTHHAIEDIAIMRAMPNMTVLVPGDAHELEQVFDYALRYDGPVYIRLGAGDAYDVYEKKNKFEIGKATQLRPGNDAAIITTGTLMYEGVCVADILAKKHGIKVRVLQMASVKPIDAEAIARAAQETKNIITIEEHNCIGGLGGAVCEIAAESGLSRVKRLGINDHFCSVGSASCLLEEEGLSVERIVSVIEKFLEKK